MITCRRCYTNKANSLFPAGRRICRACYAEKRKLARMAGAVEAQHFDHRPLERVMREWVR